MASAVPDPMFGVWEDCVIKRGDDTVDGPASTTSKVGPGNWLKSLGGLG